MKNVFEYTVTDPNGLHARPAGLLVKKTRQMPVKITMECREGSADGKKLLAVMGLGVRNGDCLRVTVEGDMADRYAEELKCFLEENL